MASRQVIGRRPRRTSSPIPRTLPSKITPEPDDSQGCCGWCLKKTRSAKSLQDRTSPRLYKDSSSGPMSPATTRKLSYDFLKLLEVDYDSSPEMSCISEESSYVTGLSEDKGIFRSKVDHVIAKKFNASEDAYFTHNKETNALNFTWRNWDPSAFHVIQPLKVKDKPRKMYIAIHIKSGYLGIMKALTQSRVNEARREFNALTVCRSSPFIIRIMDAFSDLNNKRFYLFLEYAPFKTLDHLTRALKGIKEPKAKLYIMEIVCALDYMHDRKIVHRDIKPENVLILLSGHVALADLGSTFFTNSTPDGMTKSRCGAYVTRPPEVWHGDPYSFEVDIWELGITVFNIISNTWPIMHAHRHLQVDAVTKAQFKFGPAFSTVGADFIMRMLQSIPQNRWTTKQLMTHEFFSDLIPPYRPTFSTQELMNILDMKDDIYVTRLIEQVGLRE